MQSPEFASLSDNDVIGSAVEEPPEYFTKTTNKVVIMINGRKCEYKKYVEKMVGKRNVNYFECQDFKLQTKKMWIYERDFQAFHSKFCS